MRVILPCCAGLDGHERTVVACARDLGPDGREDIRARTFGAMTADLLESADWLEARGVRHVVMASTGVCWKPAFHLLEGRFEVMLVDAHHVKDVPGRKTGCKDAEWLAECLRHGMLRPSFVPRRRSASRAT